MFENLCCRKTPLEFFLALFGIEFCRVKCLILKIKMAEAHGNRTHPRGYQPRTSDLKSEGPTSEPRASRIYIEYTFRVLLVNLF